MYSQTRSCSCGVWFSETEQERNSLIDRSYAGSYTREKSARKRSLDNNGDYEAAPAKRQRPHDGEAEFKYVTLADREPPLSDHTLSLPLPVRRHTLGFSEYCHPQLVENDTWRENSFTTNTFKSSHFNTAH